MAAEHVQAHCGRQERCAGEHTDVDDHSEHIELWERDRAELAMAEVAPGDADASRHRNDGETHEDARATHGHPHGASDDARHYGRNGAEEEARQGQGD